MIRSLPPNRLPLEHSREEIVPKEGKRDPFLYNPRTKAVGAGKVRVGVVQIGKSANVG